MAKKSGNDGHFLVEWSLVQNPKTEILSNGNSLEECFLLHLGKNMLIASFSSSYFFLIFRVSKWEPIVLKIFVLKFSKRFPIPTLMIPLELTGFKFLL
jgi:hypothetical protein